MRFHPEEITSVLKKEIEAFRSDLDVAEVGSVLEVGDGIARIYGLDRALAGEMLEFEGGVRGQVFNLEEGSIGAIVLGDYKDIKEGQTVRRTGALLEVPVGEALIGRVVDALGNPIDGKGPIQATATRPVEMIAPGIADRQPVKEPLQTGIKAIDAMTPIGRGQRELIIGDRKTGKTAIALDTIINQKLENVVCVYVAIGSKESTVAGIVEELRKAGAMDYTIVVVAASSAPAPLQYIAPYSGVAMAEHLMYTQKRHTLCVYDDLTKQAAAYRQLSLLLRRPPGREAYPGDVFYLHSRLLERAVKLSADLGGGSLTALPIIETQEGEVSAYIPTNVISITDGQIYLVPDLFRANVRPAIDVGISVSRVGGSAQVKAMKAKSVAGGLRLNLAAFRELEAFAQLGTELDKTTQAQIDRGRRMVEILKQPQFKPMHVVDQVVVIYAGANGFIDPVPLDKVRDYEARLLKYVHENQQQFWDKLNATKELTKEIEEELKRILTEFTSAYVSGRAPDPRLGGGLPGEHEPDIEAGGARLPVEDVPKTRTVHLKADPLGRAVKSTLEHLQRTVGANRFSYRDVPEPHADFVDEGRASQKQAKAAGGVQLSSDANTIKNTILDAMKKAGLSETVALVTFRLTKAGLETKVELEG